MNFPYQSVKLEEIDFDDLSFSFSYPSRAPLLRDSLDLIGLIHPPVVRQQASYQIICGRGRLLAAKELGVKEITCKVLPSWIDDLTCLAIAFEENITVRELNLVEKALVVEKFQAYLPDEEIVEKILPRLGFSGSYKNLEFLQKINFLWPEAKEMLVKGELNPKAAVRLLDLEEEDAKEVFRLFKNIRPSSNRQRQILELLEDLSRREEKKIVSLLTDPQVQKILEDQKLNPPQKTERLFALLRRRLMPHLTEKEKEVQKLAQALARFGMRLKWLPSFEKDNFSVELEFKDFQEFLEKLSSLEEIRKALS